jgi:hypothetical protein
LLLREVIITNECKLKVFIQKIFSISSVQYSAITMFKLIFFTALATAPASFAATPAVKETFTVPKTTTVSDFIQNRATFTANNAERIQKKATAALRTNNLRKLKKTPKSKGKKDKEPKSEPKSKSKGKNGPSSILYVGNSEPDCSGVGIEAGAWVLDACDRALSAQGAFCTRRVSLSLSLLFFIYI